MQEVIERCEALVYGNDLFALCSAILLQEAGVKTVLLQTEDNPFSHPILWPSLNDPPTRSHIAHGYEVAKYLSHFCANGVKFLKSQDWAKRFIHPLKSLWVSTENFQKKELEIASNLELGLAPTQSENEFIELECGGVIENHLELFESGLQCFIKRGGIKLTGNIVDIEETSHGVYVNFKLESKIALSQIVSELLVIGIGHKISHLLPVFQNIAVPMLESHFVYKLNPFSETIGYKSAIGHWWAASHKNQLWVSGPRFLLPQAGVGCTVIPKGDFFLKKQKVFHEKSLLPLLRFKPLTFVNSFHTIGCWPCDELPVLGELGNWGRVIGTFGWLSVENSAGPWCAFIVCQLALNGFSEFYNPRLGKNRLMNL